MHVSHPEISCVLWKRLYHSNKSILCHGLGFDIKSGLPCYLEFYTNNHSSRLFSHHDSLIPHHLPFLCMYMCTHVYLWIYVYSMEYFLRVFFLSFLHASQMHSYFFTITLDQLYTLPKFNVLSLHDRNIFLAT